ncbi:bifunctional diaminohydroxyphosphoribosylaminopyrimidine deaminase/5-amino-6-(5-phosphoribosylamino)uracil reductase RibD [Candidatus Woesearchaeota archaeon]|nr:bifunctional diaminohydroxyphosphoribosylaminopyrimidine deaminase/5-amino-6-(5-phosphoribosylamino)uracil reductase RibD [Candidatus Woesearchaeota archaeon]
MIPHKKYMQQAIALAQKGDRKVSPDPKVGCIIVKRGQVIGRGYQKAQGQEHAEIIALEQAQHKARDSIMYITLEPCSQWGKKAPCTEKIVGFGVREVVVGMRDPTKHIDGYEILKLRGIKTRIGILQDECVHLNEAYIKYSKKKMPFVTLKAGYDGKLSAAVEKSKIVKGKEIMKVIHTLRDEIGVSMMDFQSIKKENPTVDAKIVRGDDLMKLIIDPQLSISPKAKVMDKPDLVIIACSERAPKAKIKKFETMGVHFILTKTKNKMVDLKKVLKQVAKHGYNHVLLEGGPELTAAMLKEGFVDKVALFGSPKIVNETVEKISVKELGRDIPIQDFSIEKIGKNNLLISYL